MPDVVCLGEALIDFIPLESGVPLMEVTAFKKAPGGAPANVAAGLSKLGNPSAFVGKVGDDPFGHFLEKTFRENGVDTSRLIFDKTALTGLAFVALSAEGVPEFMFYRNPSADMLLRQDELDMQFIKSAKAFHFGSITLISEPCKSATEAAIKCSVESNLLISYDPNLRKPLWPSLDQAKKQMLAAMIYPHVVKVSEEELAFLTNKSDVSEGAKELISSYPNIALLAITLGAEGCYFRTTRLEGYEAALKVKVVDTTGAGDGFVAGMLSCLLALTTNPNEIASLEKDEIHKIFKFANAVAGITTTKHGAITALPTRAEVEAIIKQYCL
ncbi:MAG: PfkB family carbohydrate kinase [Armatimonadota bacterium]|nr:PfkB family carbohydrate kinase [Armatimonadota bacterium]